MIDPHGAPRAIIQDGDDYAVETRTHSIPAKVTLDADGLIDGLLFEQPVALTASLSETLEKFGSLVETSTTRSKRMGRPASNATPTCHSLSDRSSSSAY